MPENDTKYRDSSTRVRIKLFYVQLLTPIASLPLAILFLFINYQVSILIAAGVIITTGIAHKGKQHIISDGESGWSKETVEWIPMLLFLIFIGAGIIMEIEILIYTAMMFGIISLLFFFYATSIPGDGRRLF